MRRALIASLLLVGGCRKQPEPVAPTAQVVAEYKGGVVTRAEVDREGARLPPLLRPQFDSEAGRQELAGSMVDKRLLVAEAARRGYDADPEIRRQVDELRDRLMVQALLANAERTLPPITEAEERAWFEAHKSELGEPERLHLGRVLFRAKTPGAKSKAEAVARKLKSGAKFETVAALGEGPEKNQKGDLGLLARGDLGERAAEDAAFALSRAGEATAPIKTAGGYAVLVLIERKPARAAVFEEVRPQIRARLDPSRKRKAFDDLRLSLRKQNDVRIHAEAAK